VDLLGSKGGICRVRHAMAALGGRAETRFGSVGKRN